jgi:hypothetical protein
VDYTEYENLTPEIIASKSPEQLKEFFDFLFEDQFYNLSADLVQAITPEQIINTWKITGFVLPFLNSDSRKSPFLNLTPLQIHYYNITIGNHLKIIDNFTDEYSHRRIIWPERVDFRRSYLGGAGYFDSYVESEMASVDDGIPGGKKVVIYIPPDPPPPPTPPYEFYNPLYSDFFSWQNILYPGIKGEDELGEELYSDFFAWQNILNPGIKEESAHPTPLHSETFTYQNEDYDGISENL